MKQLFTLFFVVTILLSYSIHSKGQGTDYISLSKIVVEKCSKVQEVHETELALLKKQLKDFNLEERRYNRLIQHLDTCFTSEQWYKLPYIPTNFISYLNTTWLNQFNDLSQAWLKNIRRFYRISPWLLSPHFKSKGLQVELEFIEFPKQAKILELGAGDGSFTTTLKLLLLESEITVNEVSDISFVETGRT